MNLEPFESKCLFYDAVHFPHGFNRAGIFTRTEASILQRCGYMIKQLTDYHKAPEHEAEKHLLAVAHGEAVADTLIEKTWMKYQTHIANHHFLISCGMACADNDSEYVDDANW